MTYYDVRGHKHRGRIIDTTGCRDGIGILDCHACGWKHVYPLPPEPAAHALYSYSFYEQRHPDYFARYEEDAEHWQRVADDRLDAIAAFMPPPWGRVLDLGCGPGWFLARAMERDVDLACGFEVAEPAIAYARARGLAVERVPVDWYKRADDRHWDVVHAHEVCEHVSDPAAVLVRIAAMLTDRGVAVLTVPNDFSPVQDAGLRKLGGPPWWLSLSEHLHYWTARQFTRLVEACGLQVVRSEASWPFDMALLEGPERDYRGNDDVGRRIHRERMAREAALDAAGLRWLRRKLAEEHAALGIGREITVYARRA